MEQTFEEIGMEQTLEEIVMEQTLEGIGMRSVLFLSFGGKCRAPVAAAIFQKIVVDKNVADKWFIDFAALSYCHSGEFIDGRVMDLLAKHCIRAYWIVKPITYVRFEEFEFIFYMDELDKRLIKQFIYPLPENVKFLGEYHPKYRYMIKDPYYNIHGFEEDKGFDELYDQCLECCMSFFKKTFKPPSYDVIEEKHVPLPSETDEKEMYIPSSSDAHVENNCPLLSLDTDVEVQRISLSLFPSDSDSDSDDEEEEDDDDDDDDDDDEEEEEEEKKGEEEEKKGEEEEKKGEEEEDDSMPVLEKYEDFPTISEMMDYDSNDSPF